MDGFVQILSDPNIAYILLTVGALGLLAELFHPGVIVTGVLGAICLILSFIGLGQLPVSWGGLALLGLAAGLFAFELTAGVSGLLSIAALIAFVCGSFALYDAPRTGAAIAVNPWLIGLMSLLIAAFLLVVVQAVRRSRQAPVTIGVEGLRGRQAEVVARLHPRGKVRLNGEIWTAELEPPTGAVESGLTVEVAGLEGVILKVRVLPVAHSGQWSGTGWSK